MLSSKLISREYLPIVLGRDAHGNLGKKMRKIKKGKSLWANSGNEKNEEKNLLVN